MHFVSGSSGNGAYVENGIEFNDEGNVDDEDRGSGEADVIINVKMKVALGKGIVVVKQMMKIIMIIGMVM